MTSPQEFSARAALCRQLAKREPDSKNLWLAEAERWSRLKQEPSVAMDTRHDEPAETWCWEVIPVLPGLKDRRERRVHRGLKGLPAIPVQKATQETLEQ
jgi:hypothetical protein